MIGRTISHYCILEKLGQGAMGQVYLAQDKLLPRKVALKFLSEEMQRNDVARKRFLREAESSAAIDHPYICNIFEIGEFDGKAFLAFEYVEGPTLADKLADGPLPFKEALKTAAEIAEALQEAHAKGIVHRDLKPANIMFTSTGHVKILDFGLAKRLEEWPQGVPGMAETKASGETLTVAGTALGTPYYMSPEQVLGEPLDARSDIFALGVLLYEMATAVLPFKGSSMGAVFNEILHKAPTSAVALNPELPAELGPIIKRALEKDQDLRHQSAGELLADLRRLRREADSRQVAPVRKPIFSTTAKISMLAGLLIFAGLLLLVWNGYPSWTPRDKRVVPAAVQATHRQVTFSGDARNPAVSPDGQSVAFVSGQRLMLRDISGGQSVELLRGKMSVNASWSPDGSEVLALVENGNPGSFIIPRLGGNARRLGRVVGYSSWSPDGTRIAAAGQTSKGFIFFDPETEAVTRFIDSENPNTRVNLSSLAGAQWQWLYGLDWSKQLDLLLINTGLENGRSAIWTVRPDGTGLAKVYEDPARLDSPRWAPRKNAIYSLRVVGDTTELIKIRKSGGEEKYQADVLMAGLQTYSTTHRRGSLSLSADGTRLLYTRALEYSNLWSAQIGEDGTGNSTKKLTEGTSFLHWPSISPDGEWVAFSRGQGNANIYKMRLEGGEPVQLTFFDADSGSPAWSPDGRQLAFASNQGNSYQVWIVKADGSGPRAFSDTRSRKGGALIWAPNSEILYQLPGNRNFHFLDPETAEEKPLVKDESVGWIFYPRYSLDGRKIAVHWNRIDDPRGRRPGIWIVSLEDSVERFIPQTRDFSRIIGWSPDGNWIYSHASFGGNTVHAVAVDGGQSRTLFTMPGTILGGTITPDGRKIVCSVLESKSDVWLAENFDPDVAAPED